jgi:hypothetical protein
LLNLPAGTSRYSRAFFNGVAITAFVVVLLGYAREIAIALGTPVTAVGGRLFNLNGEHNLPAWFSALLLLSIGIAMLLAAFREFHLRMGTAWGWLPLGLGFVYLAVDEKVGYHEKFNDILPAMDGVFYHSWVLFAIPALIVVGLVFIPFLRHLPRGTSTRLFIAGLVYVAGCVGVEMIGSLIRSMGAPPTLYAAAYCVEETLEIVGAVLALRCVMLHLACLPQRITSRSATGT